MDKQLFRIMAVLLLLLLCFSCDGTLSIELNGLWYKSDNDDGVNVDQYLLIQQDGTFSWLFYYQDEFSAEDSFQGKYSIDEETWSVILEPEAEGDAAAEPIIRNFVMKNEGRSLYLLQEQAGVLVGDRFMLNPDQTRYETVLQDMGGSR